MDTNCAHLLFDLIKVAIRTRWSVTELHCFISFHPLDIILSVRLLFTVLLTFFKHFLTAIYIYSYLKTVWFFVCFSIKWCSYSTPSPIHWFWLYPHFQLQVWTSCYEERLIRRCSTILSKRTNPSHLKSLKII